MKYITRIMTAIAIAGLLGACDDSSDQPVAAVNTSQANAAVNLDNAESLVYGSNETIRHANSLAIDIINQVYRAHAIGLAPSETMTIPDYQQGDTTVSYIDKDNNGLLSSGDELTVSRAAHSVSASNDVILQTPLEASVVIEFLSVFENDIQLKLIAITDQYSMPFQTVPGLYNDPAIDRSNPGDFILIEEESNTEMEPVSFPVETFSLSGTFTIDFVQTQNTDKLEQTINLSSDSMVFDFSYSLNDLVIFSDQFSGDLIFSNRFQQKINQVCNFTAVMTAENFLDCSSPYSINSTNDFSNEVYFSAAFFSLEKNISFYSTSSENLGGNSSLFFDITEFNYGSILLSSDNSFAKITADGNNWVILIDNAKMLSPSNPLISPTHASTIYFPETTQLECQEGFVCTPGSALKISHQQPTPQKQNFSF